MRHLRIALVALALVTAGLAACSQDQTSPVAPGAPVYSTTDSTTTTSTTDSTTVDATDGGGFTGSGG